MSTVQVRTLYPAIEPFATGTLEVDGTHTLYYEQFGNPEGKPAVFLHGGPGGGANRPQARFWNPDRYHAVLFDQRGCGKSTPHACLDNNTTQDLVEDMEKLRKHLSIERWQVFGGSWGSTLALAYAQEHPQRVTEMVLRGIFTLRKREIDWFYQDGAGRIFPDAWARFQAPIPEDERGDMVGAYHRRLMSDEPEMRMEAAKAWSIWEASTSTLYHSPDLKKSMGESRFALALARIECHYFVNRGFFERDDQLFEQMHKIHGIPATIVQGRYDVVCPMESAWRIANAWPGTNLIVAGSSGHSAFEREILHHLVVTTDKYGGVEHDTATGEPASQAAEGELAP